MRTEYVAGYAETLTPPFGAEVSSSRERVEEFIAAGKRRRYEDALDRVSPLSHTGVLEVDLGPELIVLTRQVTDWAHA